MPAQVEFSRDHLIGKSRLSVAEMTQLIAATVAELPTVKAVAVEEDGEIAVDLVTGKRIELATFPVAHQLNESIASRRTILDDLVKRCA